MCEYVLSAVYSEETAGSVYSRFYRFKILNGKAIEIDSLSF